MKNILDFSLVPDLSYVKAWAELDKDLIKALDRLPNVLGRAKNAINFCARVSAESVCTQLREGFLRAALLEFVSIEDVLIQDLKNAKINSKPLKCYHTKNPMLHIIHELRNFEIHLHSGKLSSTTISAFWGNIEYPENASPIKHKVWMIDDLTEDGFSRLNNSMYYTKDQIKGLVEWFNTAQKEWGVNFLIHIAVESYCRAIVQQYSLL